MPTTREQGKMSYLSTMDTVSYFNPTGRFFAALKGNNKGKTGEAILFLDWGGVILQFPDGEKATYAIYDVQEIKMGVLPAKSEVSK
jgi:hypothetical protein